MVSIILIIDDDPAYARSLARLVQRDGARAELAYSGEEGLERARDVQPDLALVDMSLPGIDGVEVIKRLREREPHVVCMVVTAHATVESAVAAMHAGAFDFISKTAQMEEIQFKLRKGLEVAELRRNIQYLRDQERRHLPLELIGESPAMREVYARIDEIAATPTTTVLILGETGTGKELVARAIHGRSERRDRPQVTVNCTAIPDALVESELFGHERGAFTGADRAKKGLLELADRGSLFLDEIGDLELALQGKLLRVMEDRRFKRVGGLRDIEVELRFMAATNRNLEEMAQTGLFRSDLLYRLNVFQIVLPPLRERGEDILILARYFVQQFNAQLGKEVTGLDREAERSLLAHPFPGNVRQLRNLVEQAMIQTRGDRLTAELLRGTSANAWSSSASPSARFERPPEGAAALGPAAAVFGGGPPAGAPTTPGSPGLHAPGHSPGPGSLALDSPGLRTEPGSPAPSAADHWNGTGPGDGSPGQLLAQLRQREEQLWNEERAILQRALTQCKGNKTRAAQLLGLSRYALLRRLRRLSEPAPD